MFLNEEVERIARTLTLVSRAEYSPRAGGCMESRIHCAYNQTRECFLGLEIEVEDISRSDLEHRIAALNLKSGEGLWIAPCRRIPAVDLRVPLDLVYLDEACRVIEVVESFPSFRATLSSAQVASVLALPIHSIYLSQTQAGDQMLICRAEEMEQSLERLTPSIAVGGAEQSAALLREKPLWSGGPGLLELGDRTGKDSPLFEQTHEMGLQEPKIDGIRPPRNWLERWWSPDPRKAPRNIVSGLAAYYWTGAAPTAHSVRDISSTGLYVVTEERWYPGTLVLMTLQDTGCEGEASECSVSVYSKAIRWGDDGVGLKFVLQGALRPLQDQSTSIAGMDKKDLEMFLHRLRKRKG